MEFQVGDEVEFTQDVNPELPPEMWDLCPWVSPGVRGTITDVRHDSVYVSLDKGTIRGAGIRLYHGHGCAPPHLITADGPVIRVVRP